MCRGGKKTRTDLSYHPVGPGGGCQVVRRGSKCFYLTSPTCFFLSNPLAACTEDMAGGQAEDAPATVAREAAPSSDLGDWT